jgi:predicted metalloprotease with PDZ domain
VTTGAGADARVTTGAGADARVTTGADGRFAIDDVAPGRHSVSVEAPGYVGRTESGVTTSAGQRASLDIRLTPLDPAAAAKGAHPVEFAGIGAVITGQGDALVVMELIPGGPAETAGVVRGDVVLAVDGQPVAGRTLPDVIEDIRGVVGTYVRLSLRRGDRELTLDIVRGTVRVGG